jgi:uncharacterized membrane protein
MDGRALTIFLRLIHILAGIFWVGSAFLMAGFLMPAMRATGAEGGRFVQTLMQRQRLPFYLGVAGVLTVLSGAGMYARMAAATHGTWAGTPQGIAFGVGGLAAIVGALTGSMISGAAGRRMAAIGQSVGPGRPSPEQQAEMGRLQDRIGLGTKVTALFLAIAAGSMAVARYL